jgi:PmbA protein
MSERDHDLAQVAIDRARRSGAREADVWMVESDELSVRVRGEEIEFVKQARERTLGLRALVDGEGGLRRAVTSTADLAFTSVERLAEDTVALARATASDPHAGLPERFAPDQPDLALFDPADHPAKAEERVEVARRMERAARAVDRRVTNSEGSEASSSLHRVTYANSRGFLGSYSSAMHALYSGPLAEEAGRKQHDHHHCASRTLAGLEPPEQVGRLAGERAVARLGARRVATCEVPVIFEARVASGLLASLLACVTGGAVYRQASFLIGRLGERIGSDRLTVIDDGRLRGGLGSKPFDGEGQATRRNVVVDAGVLRTWLLDCYAARRLGARTTGSASRSPAGEPAAGATNLWVQAGEGDLDDLVRATDRGLLVTQMLGMGFNPVTGDYSRGAAGFWIEHGRRVHPVEEVTVAGNLGGMLAALDAVGADLVWSGRLAAPSLRIARMTVAGS